MTSKLVEDARKLTTVATSAITSHLPAASDTLDQAREALGCAPLRLSEALEGGKALTATLTALEEAEGALLREGIEDSLARQERDRLFGLLFENTSQLGAAVTNAYGRALTEALKLDGLTPRAPNQLINYAERFLQASQPMPTIPAPLKAWLAFDLAAARAEIEPLVPALKASQQTVAREERETQQTRLQRDRAHARWLEQMNLHIQITRAALRAAQLGELADRLLPTARQLQGVEPPGPTPDDSPPSPATP